MLTKLAQKETSAFQPVVRGDDLVNVYDQRGHLKGLMPRDLAQALYGNKADTFLREAQS